VRGLRTRLLLAFALLSAVTAAAVAGGVYVRARTVILQEAQDAAARIMIDRIEKLFPLRGLPPNDDEIAGALSDRDNSVLVVRKGQTVDIPAELRREVQGGHVAWQRVTHLGVPSLIVGTQLVLSLPNHTTYTPDLEIYTERSLLSEQDSIDKLATTAWLIGGGSVLLAMLLALVAARGVLRPVRDLRLAAHRLGEGDFTTRVPVRGADELAGVAHTFNTTAEALERQVDELRRFVADVSHELRTPLAAMSAVTDILDEEAPHLPGDAGKAARLVSQETQNLTRLVNDLMEVSRFDAKTAALALDDINVAAAVNATLQARGWTNAVVTHLPPTMARLDPRRLDVIIANLIGNALRHGAPPVEIRLWADPAWIIIEVTDHGPGLDPAVLPHVFDRFYKADTARTRSEGSGLGLAIAWENARLHNGTLTAGNRPDRGAVFTLRLPREGGMW
jgi:two-component system, OmpR family, sensor histidine kinase MtrB